MAKSSALKKQSQKVKKSDLVFFSQKLKKIFKPLLKRKIKSAVAIDVSVMTSYADILIIIETSSKRQTISIAQNIIKEFKKAKTNFLSIEGMKEGTWVLIDCGDMILHIFDSETNSFYNLQGLWADAPTIDLKNFKKEGAGSIKKTKIDKKTQKGKTK